MTDHKKVLLTERLLIRPTDIKDAAFIYDLMNSPKYLQFIGDKNMRTIRKAEEYIRLKMIPHMKQFGYGNFTVLHKDNQRKLGSCGLYQRDGVSGVDLGFAFLPDFEKNGYAFEACTQLMKAAWDLHGITALNAYTSEGNVASQKLLNRLGFERNGNMQFPEEQEILLAFKTNLTLLV